MGLSILDANNPAAIRPLSRSVWLGQDGVVHAGRSGTFARFSEMKWGLRAALRNLDTYMDKHGLFSVQEIISRWAPSSENNTSAYINSVCERLGVRPNERLKRSYAATRNLLLAIVSHETGGWQPSISDLDAACRIMAVEERRRGGDPSPYISGKLLDSVKRVPLERPKQSIVAGGAVGSGILATAYSYFEKFREFAGTTFGGISHSDLLILAKIAGVLLAVCLIAWAVYSISRKNGRQAIERNHCPECPARYAREDHSPDKRERGLPEYGFDGNWFSPERHDIYHTGGWRGVGAYTTRPLQKCQPRRTTGGGWTQQWKPPS